VTNPEMHDGVFVNCGFGKPDHLGEILPHYYELCRIFARPCDVLCVVTCI
jgi:hypothetical protein